MDRPGGSYDTDVTDDVSARILPLLAGRREGVSDSELRAVLNALLYRQRTGLGWRFLPYDLDGGELARACDERWADDGIRDRILKAAAPAAPPPPPCPPPPLALRAFRKGLRLGRAALGRAGRTLPGRLAMRVGRWCGRLARSWRPEPTAVAPPPPVGDAAEAAQARIYGEIAFIDRLVEANPRNQGAFLRRATLYHELGRNREAVFDAWRAYALIGNQGGEQLALHSLLARILVCLGDIERALMHMFQYHWLCRFGGIHPVALGDGGTPSDALGLQVWIESHDDLAETAINTTSSFTAAFQLYRQKVRYQRQFVESFGVTDLRTLYLTEDWVRNVGHMALIDFWIKLAHLGWRSWDRVVLLAPENGTANASYLDYWRPYCTVVSDPHLYALVRPFGLALGVRVASLLELPAGRDAYFLEGMGAIQEEWERQGREPLLSLTAEDYQHGRKVLKNLGVPVDAWFVCLHVRTPGFHREGETLHQAHRNADIRSYLPAIREITRRGGWVIRLGDPSMPPLPPMPGVIDYALSPVKSARMDVFLVGACRFYVGVASGLAHLPTTFGVPCVFTNWVSNTLPVYGSRDLFLPKLRRSKTEDRRLTFEEWLAPEMRALCYAGTKMAEHGLAVLDNTPQELREVVLEMVERLEGKAQYTDDDRQRLECFRALATRHGLIGFSQIGRDFLRRHAALLPAAAKANASALGRMPVALDAAA